MTPAHSRHINFHQKVAKSVWKQRGKTKNNNLRIQITAKKKLI